MKQGYTTLPDMLTPAHLQALDAALGAAPENSRRMLQLNWCQELAEEVRVQLVAAPPDEYDKARAKAGAEAVLCPVAQGAGMAMRPLLLHASSKATGSSRRRVLHFLFGPPALPFGLEWA